MIIWRMALVLAWTLVASFGCRQQPLESTTVQESKVKALRAAKALEEHGVFVFQESPEDEWQVTLGWLDELDPHAIPINLLSPLDNLHLTLRGEVYDNKSLQQFKQLKNITAIDFDIGTTIDDRGLAMLLGLQQIGKICFDNSAENASVKVAAQFENLRSLEFGLNTNIDDDGMRHVADITQLESLHIGNHHVTDEGLRRIASMPQLKEIGITYASNITADGLKCLRHVPQLERLSISEWSGDMDRAARIFRLLHRLKHLILDWTQLSDAGLEHLAEAKSLETLTISRTNVTDKGLSHLARIPSLRELDVSHTAITDDGLRALAGCKELRKLTLHGTDLTIDRLSEFRRLNRQCEIER